jgi:hypothetical protein
MEILDPSFGRRAALVYTDPPLFVPKEPPKPPCEPPWPDLVSLDLVYKIDYQHEVSVFRESGVLSQKELATFTRLHRLDRPERDLLMSTLSQEQIEAHGLRFSDEVVLPHKRSGPLAALRATAESAAPAPHRLNIQAILMDGWHTLDPLLLELLCDAVECGVNLGYNGLRDLIARAAAFPLSAPEAKILRDSVDENRSRGWTLGYFPHPPFATYRVVPVSLVLKSDGSMRVVKNHSVHCPLSTNDLSDHADCPFERFSGVVENFCHAGGLSSSSRRPGHPHAWTPCTVSSWDVKHAYPLFWIRVQDRHLTVSFIPGRGWVYRRAMDFGNARAGFCWEILGGRMYTALYQVMSDRLSVTASGRVRVAPPPVTNDNLSTLRRPPLGFGHLRGRQNNLAPAGARRVQDSPTRRVGGVSLRGVSRFVDDQFKANARPVAHSTSPSPGARDFRAVQFLHLRYGYPLNHAKSEIDRSRATFRGATFDGDTGHLSFLPEKRQKILVTCQDLLAAPLVSVRGLQVILGKIDNYCGIFPNGKSFSSGLRHDLFVAKARRGSKKRADPTTALSCQGRSDLEFWLTVCRVCPKSSVAFLRSPLRDTFAADAIFHTDWGRKNPSGLWDHGLGAVCLTHRRWSMARAPARWIAAATGPLSVSSPLLEACALIFALFTFEELVSNSNVLIFTDNVPLLQAFHRMFSEVPAMAEAMRVIASILVAFNCHLVLRYVPSDENFADPLSHYAVQDFVDVIGKKGLSMPSSPTKPRFPPRRFYSTVSCLC